MFSQNMVDVFREYSAVLQTQQRMMEERPNAPRINISVYAAAIQAGRMLDEMIAAEAKP